MKNVVHVWKPTTPETKCGLWFRLIPAMRKPNIINERAADRLKPPVLCGNCYHSQQRKDRKTTKCE